MSIPIELQEKYILDRLLIAVACLKNIQPYLLSFKLDESIRLLSLELGKLTGVSDEQL